MDQMPQMSIVRFEEPSETAAQVATLGGGGDEYIAVSEVLEALRSGMSVETYLFGRAGNLDHHELLAATEFERTVPESSVKSFSARPG